MEFEHNELHLAIENVLKGIFLLWSLDSFTISEEVDFQEVVKTEYEGEDREDLKGVNLPRGCKDVIVLCLREAEESNASVISRLVFEAIFGIPFLAVKYQPADVVEARSNIEAKIIAFREVCRTIPGLLERIFESKGFKHFEKEELAERAENLSLLEVKYFFANLLELILNKIRFRAESYKSLNAHEEIVSELFKAIWSLAQRSVNKYDVCIFFNAPIIIEKAPLELGSLPIHGQNTSAVIEYASDSLLTRLYGFDSSLKIPITYINTVVKFPLSISLDASPEEYMDIYNKAGKVAEVIGDCLRLSCEGDIGVIAIEAFPAEEFTPRVRSNNDISYRSEHAIYLPKRFVFQISDLSPLNMEKIALLKKLIISYAEIDRTKGLTVSFKRFRTSCENYVLTDPEKLLDMAFAFEAIYLSDGDNKELSYRLCLRVARFLGKSLPERMKIFKSVRDLYDLRSKIAHGEVIEGKNSSNSKKLKDVMDTAPTLLRTSLIKMLNGEGPKNLSNDQIKDWWKELELR